MTILVILAALTGLAILGLAIKREIAKRVNHVDLCDKHYDKH
jgi:hypothetical protein